MQLEAGEKNHFEQIALMLFLTRNSIPCRSIKSFFAFHVMTVRIKQTMMHCPKYKPFKYDPTDSFTRFLMVSLHFSVGPVPRNGIRIVSKASQANNSKAQREERERRQFND